MLDFTKIGLLSQSVNDWLQNPLLRDSFTTSSTSDGEVIGYEAPFRELTVSVKAGGYVEVSGSLHKFYTGHTNATDFSASAIALSIDDLSQALRFKPSKAHLKNLEFGTNLPLPFPAKTLLKQAVLFGNREFTSRRAFGKNGYQLDAQMQRYTFKTYDKAAQLQILEHLLRVEMRVTRMIHLAPLKLVTLADLARPRSLEPLGGMLAGAWGKVLFCDPFIALNELPKPRRDLLQQGQNATYWHSLRPDSFRKQREQFRRWTEQYSPTLQHTVVEHDLRETWIRLLEC
jgi:ribosomal protein L31